MQIAILLLCSAMFHINLKLHQEVEIVGDDIEENETDHVTLKISHTQPM